MDPAESILSPLDYAFDSLIPPEDHFTSDLDMLGFNDYPLMDDFGNNFGDDFLSAFYPSNDPFSSSFENQFMQQQQPISNNYPSSSMFSNNSKAIFNSNVSVTSSVKQTTNTIFEKNENTKSNSSSPKIILNKPKVYVSKSKKAKGTSILVKQKKIKKSSLLSNKNSLLPNVSNSHQDNKQQNDSQTKQQTKEISNDELCWNNFSLQDHDYCGNIYTNNIDTNLFQTQAFQTNDVAQSSENVLDDILSGLCTDDVMLNELPICLNNLFNFNDDCNSHTSEDILNGLNNVCNAITDQYIAENVLDTNLPNLNLTEEIINQITQCPSSEMSEKNNSKDNDECKNEEENVQDMKNKEETVETTTVDGISNSCYTQHCIAIENLVDSCDSASVTTGCTDESFIDDKQFVAICNKMKNPKSKRHRSLSSSSTAILTKRKRRFSTRSSINSSDSMSDSSSLESSSSRSSSPERAFGDYHSSPTSSPFAKRTNYHTIDFDQLKKISANKKTNRQIMNKTWPRPFSNNNEKKKCQVIDSVNNKIYTLDSKLESGASHHHQTLNKIKNSNKKNTDNYVLYIGNIPMGCKKSDIISWFGKFGNILDVQIYTKDAKCFASVEYKNFHEIEAARKHGNDDSSHPKFLLTFDNDRPKNYKDVDSFSQKLDFRIEDNNGGGIIDEVVNNDVNFDTFLAKNFI